MQIGRSSSSSSSSSSWLGKGGGGRGERVVGGVVRGRVKSEGGEGQEDMLGETAMVGGSPDPVYVSPFGAGGMAGRGRAGGR